VRPTRADEASQGRRSELRILNSGFWRAAVERLDALFLAGLLLRAAGTAGASICKDFADGFFRSCIGHESATCLRTTRRAGPSEAVRPHPASHFPDSNGGARHARQSRDAVRQRPEQVSSRMAVVLWRRAAVSQAARSRCVRQKPIGVAGRESIVDLVPCENLADGGSQGTLFYRRSGGRFSPQESQPV
jgi:hypothetical protein